MPTFRGRNDQPNPATGIGPVVSVRRLDRVLTYASSVRSRSVRQSLHSPSLAVDETAIMHIASGRALVCSSGECDKIEYSTLHDLDLRIKRVGAARC